MVSHARQYVTKRDSSCYLLAMYSSENFLDCSAGEMRGTKALGNLTRR